jgi:hypothetical protein
MSEEKEAPFTEHPDFEWEPGLFDEDDDEPGDEDSAPVPVEDDDDGS